MSMSDSRGATLIGLLVSLVILLVLGLVMANAINKAMSGAGSTMSGTVASHQDRMNLVSMYQSMAVQAQIGEGRFLVPDDLTRRHDPSDNTTAGLFSAMIAQQYAMPEQLYSSNERNPTVWPDEDYDFTAYNPSQDLHWDPAFVAVLDVESNTSFAHLPLYGERLRRQWRFTADYRTPVLGNRGPAGGVRDPNSYTYGIDGQWAGHVVFGDGHVEYITTFTPTGIVFDSGGQTLPDNIFRMDDGPDGVDVILTFTKEMTDSGPVIQHD
jgi:prepilin-type processing-associated H-X9-DG protein